MKSTLMFYSRY